MQMRDPELHRRRRATTWTIALAGALLLCAGVWLRLDSMRRQQLEYWRATLTGGAVTTRATVDDWYSERVEDAEGLAESVATHRTMGSRLSELVSPRRRRRQVVGSWIVDARGAVIARSTADTMYDAERVAVRRAVSTQRTTASDLVIDPARSTMLTIVAPVRGGRAGAEGPAAVLTRTDAVASFSSWATGRPNSALSVLVAPAAHGVGLVRVCPGHSPPICVGLVPQLEPSTPAAFALAGRDTFGQFRDRSGQPVLAVTRFDATLGWGIVRRIDLDDAFAQFRREAEIEGGFLAALLALVTLSAVAANRTGRLRRLHERTEADVRLSTIVEASIDGLISLDERFCITMANSAIERMFVRPREWFLGRPVTELFADDAQAHIAECFDAFAATGELHGRLSDPERAIAQSSTGTRFPVDIRLGRATLDDATLFTLGVHDVSERSRTQAFLEGQHRVLELIATGAPVCDSMVALIAVVEVEAPGMRCAIYELNENGIVLTLVAAPSLHPGLLAATEEIIVGPSSAAVGTAVHCGEFVQSADIRTDPCWADCRAYLLAYGVRAGWAMPLRGADGALIGALACYADEARAPTARELELAGAAVRLASVALSSARDAAWLRASEASFRSFVENAPAAIFRETRSGHLVSTNPAMVAMLRHADAESLSGAADAGRLYIDHAARERLLEQLEEHDVVRGTQIDWRRADGTRVTVSLTARAYRDDRDRVWLWEAYAEDVTPLRQAEEALRRSEKLAALGQLISGVAHELNNPLSAILHFTEDLLSDQRNAADAEGLGVIRDQAQRSRAIVRDLLSFVRQREANAEPVALSPIVCRAARAMAPTAERAGVMLTVGVLPEAVVHADRMGLEQIVTNLLGNAVQAAGAGGEVWARTECDGVWCRLIVEDSGPGIPADILPRIFDPFFTTKPTGEGTGLGLSVTLGIVEQFGGRIVAESREAGQRGARFVVSLPISAAPVAEAAPEAPELAPETPPDSLLARAPIQDATRTVLLIDDEPTIRSALRRYFLRRGWQVEEAEDGAKALALLDAHADRYALVVSDLRIPGFTGIELHDRLAATHPGLLDRVVFSTGDVASHESASFVQRTNCPVLQKPFELRMLDALIARLSEGGAPSQVIA